MGEKREIYITIEDSLFRLLGVSNILNHMTASFRMDDDDNLGLGFLEVAIRQSVEEIKVAFGEPVSD